jgi:CRP-like cAMP-binding protein
MNRAIQVGILLIAFVSSALPTPQQKATRVLVLKKEHKMELFSGETVIKNEQIYSQGEAAKSVMYIQKGNAKFSVVSATGKVAVVAMLGPNDFFGEGCMAGQEVYLGTATAITPTTLLAIDKNELL